jgi:hypothetical protein
LQSREPAVGQEPNLLDEVLTLMAANPVDGQRSPNEVEMPVVEVAETPLCFRG